jgi:hypothetical protein
MADIDALTSLVRLKLPAASGMSIENFAGEPLLQDFCHSLFAHGDVTCFVAWGCPPALYLLRSSVGNAIVRSERLDTMLVEFYRLSQALRRCDRSAGERLIELGVLRWLCELLLSYREPALALAVFARLRRSRVRFPLTPFRDESASSIPPIDHAAIRCFSLAHEVAHVNGAQRGALEREVDADAFAFARVSQHLARTFEAPTERVLQAVFAAAESTYFMKGTMQAARIISSAQDASELERSASLANAQFAARSQALKQRLGDALSEDRNAACASIKDAMLDHVRALFAQREQMTDRHALPSEDLAWLASDREAQRELRHILLGFGCSSDTDAIDYLRSQFASADRATSV